MALKVSCFAKFPDEAKPKLDVDVSWRCLNILATSVLIKREFYIQR